jgi:hypothetical protein
LGIQKQVYKASTAASKASNAAALQEELVAYKASEVRLKERIKDKDQQVLSLLALLVQEYKY